MPKLIGRRRFDPHEAERVKSLTGMPLASFGQRFAAFAVDFLIVLVVFIPSKLLWLYFHHGFTQQHERIVIAFDFHSLFELVLLAVYFGSLTYWTNGRTPGKRLMHIRVLSLVDERISLWQSVERALGYGASMLELGTGFLQYFTHHNRCCVHDRIAETIVVSERDAEPGLNSSAQSSE